MTKEEFISLGRRVVAKRDLARTQERLGLSSAFMASLLHVNPVTYRTWKSTPNTWLHQRTAERVGRFYAGTTALLESLEEEGIHIGMLTPIYRVAPILGIPHEELLRRYRDGQFEAVDLGILGLWLDRPTIKALRGKKAH